jgi:hypothetical protein
MTTDDATCGQLFLDPAGHLMMYVRHEEREKSGKGILLVGVEGRIVVTRFVSEGEEIPGELVNDEAGRVEAVVWKAEHELATRERDAMALAMRQACEWLSPTQGEDLKALYLKAVKV